MANKTSQAEHPQGFTGRLFGRLMGWLNTNMEKAAIDQLDLRGTEKVLEVGFGSGVGIQYLVQKLPAENVAGIEPSDAMLSQATGRLSAREQKSVCLQSGTASHIPFPDQTFEGVVSVNNVQFWNLPSDLAEIRRVLKNGGLISVAVHGWTVRNRFNVETGNEAVQRLQEYFQEASFSVHKGYIGKARTREPIYLLAEKKD